MWKRILAFFSKSEAKSGIRSSNVAKERLQLVLIQDRSLLSPEVLDKMKNDLLAVIKKYVPVDEELVSVGIEAEQGNTALVASIPIKSRRAVL